MEDVEARVVTVHPELARAIRDTCHYPRQRGLRPRNIQRLALEQRGGRFAPGTAATFCRIPTGEMFLVNANHTLEAICESGISQRMVFIIVNVPDMDAVDAIYGTFDIQRTRTWTDALKAKGLDESIPLAPKIMAALGQVLNRFEYLPDNVVANDSRAVRFELMQQYATEAALIADAIANAPVKHKRVILRAAVLGVALETARFQPARASDFWNQVAMDDGLAADDPRKSLLRWLLNNPMSAGGMGSRGQSRATAIAWNAFFENRKLSLIQPSRLVQFRLTGTPWGMRGSESVPQEYARAKVEDVQPVQVDLPETDLSDLFSFGLFAHAGGMKKVMYAADKSAAK